MPMFQKAPHERGREQEIPSDALNTQLSRNAPRLSSAERGSENQNRNEHNDQGMVTGRTTEIPGECQ